MLSAKATLFEKGSAALRRLLRTNREERNPTPEELTELYASHMFTDGNLFHKHLLNKMAENIRLDETYLEEVKLKKEEGIIVFVTLRMGELEYNVFNHLAMENGLPLSRFNNHIRIRKWLPLKAIWRSYKNRIRFLAAHYHFPNPLRSGYIRDLLLKGESVTFSLDEADPTYFSKPSRDLLQALIDIQTESKKPVYIIPQQLIWDKRPRREKASVFEALFGENERPGRWRKLVLFLRHYRKRAVVKLGKPIAVRDFVRGESSELSALYKTILQSIQTEKRLLTGPPIRPRSWFVEQMFEDEKLLKTLYAVAREKHKPFESVQKLAKRYANEIAADVYYSRIEFGVACLDWAFRNMFGTLHIDAEGIKRLKKTLSLGSTVLVPNHRSHFDYLLIAYLCYQHDIVVPYVAAGINMAFWPLGTFFRRCGAFFLRRTFGGNKLYKKVFQTYLKVLIQEGYLQEFFIEGGRSRTGKLKAPRLGMLSMYSETMHEGASQDIRFMPVSITYNRVLEQQSYIQEAGGKTKKKERTRDLFKLRKFLNKRYGDIYVNFDEPISWQEEAHAAPTLDWPEKKKILVKNLARKICHAINRQVVVTPRALAASVLLLSGKKGVSVETVQSDFSELLKYLEWKTVKIANPLKNNGGVTFLQAVHYFEQNNWIKFHQGLEQNFLEILPEKRAELDFFKNTSLHYLVSLSLWSNILLTRKSDRFALENLTDSFAYFQRLFQYDFRFSTRMPLEQHLDKLCCYLQERSLIAYNNGEIEILADGRKRLKHFAFLTRSYIESYWIAWKTYLLRPIQLNEEKTLIKAMMDHGKHQLMMGNIRFPEAVSEPTFENAVQSFKAQGFFSQESGASKKLEESLEKLLDID